MLQLKYYSCDLAFEYPFETAHGRKTHQPTLIVSLGLGDVVGFGEAPAISYYDVSIQQMTEALEAKRAVIERYALTDPHRFWHFLHHLLPGQHFLIAALDIAGWDLWARLNRKPLYQMLGQKWENTPITDYTLGMETIDRIIAKIDAHPWPLYKVKAGRPGDIDTLKAIRAHTDAALRVDANEGWTFEEASALLPELARLGIALVEQPLPRTEVEAMKELKKISPVALFADESCQTEDDVKRCAGGFHGINIKLTKCGGITPAIRMISEARSLGLKVMMGSMNESSVGTAAIASMLPLLDEADADGPLLLCEDVADGLVYENGVIRLSGGNGLGVRFTGKKAVNRQYTN